MDKTREYISIKMLHKLSLMIEISNGTDNFYNCFKKTLSPVTLTKICDQHYVKQDFVNFPRKSKQPNTGSKIYLLWEKYSHASIHHHCRATGKTTIKTETCCICLTYVLDGFDRSYDGVIGSIGVSNDVIVVHIHNIYLIFPNGWVQIWCLHLFFSADDIRMLIADPESTIKDRNEPF